MAFWFSLALALTLGAAETGAAEFIEAFGIRWRVPIAADWRVTQGPEGQTLQLLVPRPATQPRRPAQYALAETSDYQQVTLEAEVKKEPEAARNRRTSLIIVYAWRGPDRFRYAHLSVDSGAAVEVHNGIFRVDGGDRVRISSREGPAALAGENWHHVRLDYDGREGRVHVWVNGKTSPSLRAVDPASASGKVGLGSFFDLGEFRRVRIKGRTAP